MQKFRVLCDPNAKSNGSSRIIVDSINNAAKKLDLFDDRGAQVVYDCLCQDHNLKADVLWSAYELNFPVFLLNSANGRPILGLSKDNAFFAIYGGYPADRVNYVSLGVDSEAWRYCYKETKTDKFIFLCACESNTRSGFGELISGFGRAFSGDDRVQLYIKDRNATDIFKAYVKEMAEKYKIDIVHDDRDLHTIEEQLDLFKMADAFLCVNRSHTFGMNRLQALSCGVPLLTISYSGGSDYLQHPMAALEIEFDIRKIDNDELNELTSIGLKNHLFPMNEGVYLNQPFWAIAREESIKEQLRSIFYDQSGLCKNLSVAGRRLAQWFSWQRSAVNMSLVLSEFKNKGLIA